MTFAEQDCPICGREMFILCEHCRAEYLENLRDPAQMTPMQST